MKKFLLILFLFSCVVSIAQKPKVHYGNNPRAGKYYSIRGIKMYCEIYGKGKPLLMIHGNGGSIAAFEKNIPYFSQYYKVIVADSRAQGKTTDNKDSLSFDMMADDYAALLTILKIDSAYVLGWSDGGIIAIEMAIRHPKKVIRFASTGANVIADSTALVASLWNEMENTYQVNKNRKPSNAKEANDWKLFMLDYTQPQIPWPALQKIQSPALIIAGDKDLITPEHTVAIFDHIPNAELWIVPNSSHSTLIEHAALFNKKVHTFFKAD